ncbi:PH domain-containing protein [Halosolutus gelatinilyticus]|uniref:PH domain-containing protein n=1 Tax=Halosolutus gelatinilyticus TaxID=2931975 RepID=UPI001FF356F3|nr:PH domain-containing protein [Halosolutus gelatinilyticus]
MTERNAVSSITDPDALFRLAAGVYTGVLFASGAATIAVLEATSPLVLAGAALVAFVLGSGAGIALAGRDRTLPARLGRSLKRRLVSLLPAAAFGVVALASRFEWLVRSLFVVAFAAACALLLAGHALSRAAQSRYVETLVIDEPAAAWRWSPRGTAWIDGLLLVLSLVFVFGNAIEGNWPSAIFWTVFALLWSGGRVAEGRWRVDALGTTPRLRVHDAGLVKQRPFTRSLVPWESVSHVRLREDELVLDRGLFDVRFDSAELDDPEGLRSAIDRYVSNANSPPRTAG